uniref:Uncharacterized protein n=1 Tax=Meloidogyne enterolobii TaxID=390850 RepID=A0A6V7V0G6_MELEN|nr:unnamed protein product [Meloidogyne enterolobii]
MKPATLKDNDNSILIPISNIIQSKNVLSAKNNKENLDYGGASNKLRIKSFTTKKQRSKRKYKKINQECLGECVLNTIPLIIPENNLENLNLKNKIDEKKGDYSYKKIIFKTNGQTLNDNGKIKIKKQKDKKLKRKKLKIKKLNKI